MLELSPLTHVVVTHVKNLRPNKRYPFNSFHKFLMPKQSKQQVKITFSLRRFLIGLSLSIWLYEIHSCSSVSAAPSIPWRDLMVFRPMDKIRRHLNDWRLAMLLIRLVDTENFSQLMSK